MNRKIIERVFPPFATVGDAGKKSPNLAPIVTIFGAGIAGLSAAHELIERGFSVQVVEPARRADQEYGVEVGGLARNQFARVPEDPRILHGPQPDKSRFRWSYQVAFHPESAVIDDV